jgi:hypothetical protein
MMISHAGVVVVSVIGLLGPVFETKFPMKLPSCYAFLNAAEDRFGQGRIL